MCISSDEHWREFFDAVKIGYYVSQQEPPPDERPEGDEVPSCSYLTRGQRSFLPRAN